MSIKKLHNKDTTRGSWHRYERSKDATNGAPGRTTSNKKLLVTRTTCPPSWTYRIGFASDPQPQDLFRALKHLD